MATHKSAEKRARQTIVRNARNRQVMSTMKTSIRKLRDAIETKQIDKLDALFRETQSVIAVTRRKGVIHANNMARRISRLSAQIKKAKGQA
ncbi:30S ribosomal protein S20 [bacterium]|nr:30S ribosomal protein S20 [bacterium]